MRNCLTCDCCLNNTPKQAKIYCLHYRNHVSIRTTTSCDYYVSRRKKGKIPRRHRGQSMDGSIDQSTGRSNGTFRGSSKGTYKWVDLSKTHRVRLREDEILVIGEALALLVEKWKTEPRGEREFIRLARLAHRFQQWGREQPIRKRPYYARRRK